MEPSELPEDVAVLLRDNIESYEQLELLLLIRNEPGICWTEEALSSRLCIPVSLVLEASSALQSTGLLAASTQRGEKRYIYRTQNDGFEATIGRLAQAYREHPMPVIKLMSAHAIERVRTAALRAFADAFILRKDKNGG